METASSSATTVAAPADANSVYQFKITLKRIKPPIWRRIQVPATYNFYELHCAITDAMGWFDTHLHEFKIKDQVIGEPQPSGPIWEEVFNHNPHRLDERVTKISQFFDAPQTIAKYEYDFGDGWEHDVLLEQFLPATPGVKYPKCITGRRACPPENCGGIHGYQELISIMADPNHPERADRIEYLGYNGIEEEDFKPNEFDIESVHFDVPEERRKLREFCFAMTLGGFSNRP